MTMFQRRLAVSLLALCCAASPLFSQDIELLREDFSSQPATVLDWLEPDYAIEAEGSRPDFGSSLKISRPTKVHNAIRIPFGQPCRQSRDLTVEFDYKGIGYLFVTDAARKPIGGVVFSGSLKLLTEKADSYSACNVNYDISTWIHARLVFHLAEGNFVAQFTDDAGNISETRPFPVVSDALPAMLQLGNSYPIGNVAWADNLVAYCAASSNLSGRQDTLLDAQIEATGAQVTGTADGIDIRLTDSEASVTLAAQGMPEAALLCFDHDAGMDIDAMVQNAGGQLVKLLGSGELPAAAGHYESPDTPITYNRIKLAIKGEPGARITRLGYWTPYAGNANAASQEFAEKLQGDFRLPVFEGSRPAPLMLYNLTQDPIPVLISFQERRTQKPVLAPIERTLLPGENIVEIAVDGLPTGEYLTAITDNTPEKSVRGTLIRLLRRQDLADPKAPAILKLDGRKLYLPDDWQLENCSGVEFHQGTPEAYPVTDHSMTPDAHLQHGGLFGLDNGRLWLSFYTINEDWLVSSKKNYVAFCDTPDKPRQWDIQPESQETKSLERLPNPLLFQTRFQTAKASKGTDGKEHWRLYASGQDGAIDLSRMEIKYIPFQVAGQLGHEEQQIWEGITPQERTHWPVWHKAPGESLLLSRQPLLIDGYPGGLEEGFESNDNFGGQWYSPEEKAFFFSHGRILRRYEPMNVPYDNLSKISRLVNVFRTRDGIHYDRAYMALPTLEDPVGTQHYGATHFRLKDGGPFLALVSKYFAADQRFCCDLAYSWDGFKWKQFAGEGMFLDNAPPTGWSAGCMHPSQEAFVHGGKLYWLLNWQSSGYHFYGEFSHVRENGLAGAQVKKTFEGRMLEKWPLFKYFDNDYDKLAADIVAQRITPGVMMLRKDGFFFAQAGQKTASFTTRPIEAPEARLTINAQIAEGGFIEVALCDNTGKLIRKKRLPAGDYLDTPIELTSPKEHFKLKIKMQNAKLFTIGF